MSTPDRSFEGHPEESPLSTPERRRDRGRRPPRGRAHGGLLLAVALTFAAQAACSSGHEGSGLTTSGTGATSSSPGTDAASGAPSSPVAPTNSRLPHEGQALARSERGDLLYVAQQDERALHLVALPLDPAAAPRRIDLPGRPAQVLVTKGRVLVTVRDPGLVIAFRPDAEKGLSEAGRATVPADAFGMALTPDERRVLVTSAWTHRVSSVALDGMKVEWSVDVAREPRGITVHPDGTRAYVTHVVGAEVTRLDGISGVPTVRSVALPAAPLRRREGVKDAASLAYTGVLSPDGARLFVPRQALNAAGKGPWAGQSVVDVLLTADDSALAEPAKKKVTYMTRELAEAISQGTGRGPFTDLTFNGGFPVRHAPFVAARGAVYRRSTRTLVVASEGTDSLVELDALAVEPAAHVLRRHPLRGRLWTPKEGRLRGRVISHLDAYLYKVELEDGRVITAHDGTKKLDNGSPGLLVGLEEVKRAPATHVVLEQQPDDAPGQTACGAPSGVALSEDESRAWVLCRTTWGVVEVALDPDEKTDREQRISPRAASLGKDPLSAEEALGRRLFFNAWDGLLSGGMACNGCHPEGRDDGHVWQELLEQAEHPRGPEAEECGQYLSAGVYPFFFAFPGADWVMMKGYPRQTPILAGRLSAKGPYGWKGKSPDLMSRVIRGSDIHGWELPGFGCGGTSKKARAVAIAAFARKGLVPPPREERPLTPVEERGKALFNDQNTRCATCHVPATGFTDRSVVPFGAPPRAFDKSGPAPLPYDEEQDRMFKTPSLLFVGGTPPYYHDGSAATLEEAIEQNRDRMGKTSHLSPEDRAALVAYLKTL